MNMRKNMARRLIVITVVMAALSGIAAAERWKTAISNRAHGPRP